MKHIITTLALVTSLGAQAQADLGETITDGEGTTSWTPMLSSFRTYNDRHGKLKHDMLWQINGTTKYTKEPTYWRGRLAVTGCGDVAGFVGNVTPQGDWDIRAGQPWEWSSEGVQMWDHIADRMCQIVAARKRGSAAPAAPASSSKHQWRTL